MEEPRHCHIVRVARWSHYRCAVGGVRYTHRRMLAADRAGQLHAPILSHQRTAVTRNHRRPPSTNLTPYNSASSYGLSSTMTHCIPHSRQVSSCDSRSTATRDEFTFTAYFASIYKHHPPYTHMICLHVSAEKQPANFLDAKAKHIQNERFAHFLAT